MSHAMSTSANRIHETLPQHSRFAASRQTPHASSSPIPMANSRSRESPPPPLPPPRHCDQLRAGQDPDRAWVNDPNRYQPNRFDRAPPVADSGPSSRLDKGSDSTMFGVTEVVGRRDGEADYQGSSRGRDFMSTKGILDNSSRAENRAVSEEWDFGTSYLSSSNYRLKSENQLGKRTLETSSQEYDKQLLSKIGGRKAPLIGFLAGGSADISPSHGLTTATSNPQMDHLPSLGPRQETIEKSGIRWSNPLNSAKGTSSAFEVSIDRKHSYSNPAVKDEPGLTLRPRDDSSDHGVFAENDFSFSESGIRDLNIDDGSTDTAGCAMGSTGTLKRRASSPPSESSREDRSIRSPMNDLYSRRFNQMLPNRIPPSTKYHASHGSISSNSSGSHRTGSFASSYLSTASSLTSYRSERMMGNTLSPSNDGDLISSSPFTHSPLHLERSESMPKASMLSESEPSQRDRRVSADVSVHTRQGSGSLSKYQGHFICECCPKKPKKFDSEAELRNHESEKQYTCQFCFNRFKNKNEAERHQNSLHLRRYSWSCAALAGVHAAFHTSTAHPAETDVCGYCGEEFVNPADWPSRAEHLNTIHKFGECNQGKKFFRADHFRQHLKHSHAGMSGKWTNLLENACMKEESPPKERVAPSVVGVGPLLGQGHKNKPGMITESLEES